MNLYDFHDEPKSLHAHEEADYKVVKVFWDKYRSKPEELKKREQAIAKNGNYAIQYAAYILKKPFPEGEAAIFKKPRAAITYAQKFGIRNKDAEKVIAQSPELAYEYAKKVIKGRWPEGEKAIASRATSAFSYADSVLRAPFPDGEQTIIDFGNRYMVRDYLERFPKRSEALIKLMEPALAKKSMQQK
jgi:hypothetical protein